MSCSYQPWFVFVFEEVRLPRINSVFRVCASFTFSVFDLFPTPSCHFLPSFPPSSFHSLLPRFISLSPRPTCSSFSLSPPHLFLLPFFHFLSFCHRGAVVTDCKSRCQGNPSGSAVVEAFCQGGGCKWRLHPLRARAAPWSVCVCVYVTHPWVGGYQTIRY